jgi:hypothetical protein
VPHGILRVCNPILYKSEFQNPQIFQQTISLFPEHSTLAVVAFKVAFFSPLFGFVSVTQSVILSLLLHVSLELCYLKEKEV